MMFVILPVSHLWIQQKPKAFSDGGFRDSPRSQVKRTNSPSICLQPPHSFFLAHHRFQKFKKALSSPHADVIPVHSFANLANSISDPPAQKFHSPASPVAEIGGLGSWSTSCREPKPSTMKNLSPKITYNDAEETSKHLKSGP